jgi:hypothetical protein
MTSTRLALLVIIVALLLVATVTIATNSSNSPKSPCDSIPKDSNVFVAGLTPTCGTGQASDGRLSITVNNYHFAQTSGISFHFAQNQQAPLPDEVFLLVNVTVQNIGGGNTSLGAAWGAALLNGTSYVYGTNFVANASFPGTYPNETIPDYLQPGRGSAIDLPPGSTTNFWVIFYIPFGVNIASTDITKATSLKLQLVTFKELTYGGDAEGYGAFNCQKVACQNPNAEFVIQL